MSEFDEAVIQRIKQLEREIERLQRWERPADLGLGKLSDPNADRVLFWDESAGALQWLTLGTGLTITDTTIKPSQPQFYPLTTPLTSTSWDGVAYSTTAKTLIDLSSVFGVPAGVKAVDIRIQAWDSGSAAATSCWFGVSPNNTNLSLMVVARCQSLANNTRGEGRGICACNSDGDIYYQNSATGVNSQTVDLQIWGYWL